MSLSNCSVHIPHLHLWMSSMDDIHGCKSMDDIHWWHFHTWMAFAHPWMTSKDALSFMDEASPSMDGFFIGQIFGENCMHHIFQIWKEFSVVRYDAYNFQPKSDKWRFHLWMKVPSLDGDQMTDWEMDFSCRRSQGSSRNHFSLCPRLFVKP